MTCTIQGCGRLVIARGYCSPHYWRWHSRGDPLAGPPPRQDACLNGHDRRHTVTTPSGVRLCRECNRIKSQRNYDPAKARAYRLAKKYGLTTDEVAALLVAQGGRCAICRDVPRRAVVDHDHVTGRPRGVLCDRCNCGLGFLGDDPQRVQAALSYLTNRATARALRQLGLGR